MPLTVSTGYASLTGRRERNEDYVGLVAADGAELDTKGMLLAVADGVSGSAGGREAAEYTVRGLLADYYATPDTWSIPLALDRVLNANNRWLMAQGAAHRELAGMATTLSALVLRGARYYTAHIGDTRIYLLRNGRFARLTTDHVWDRPDMRHVLSRAIGLDAHLAMDYAEDHLQAGDVFVLVSDGVWEPLGDRALRDLLARHDDCQAAAEALPRRRSQGGRTTPAPSGARAESGRDAARSQAGGSVCPPPRAPGHAIDGFECRILHDSRATCSTKSASARAANCGC